MMATRKRSHQPTRLLCTLTVSALLFGGCTSNSSPTVSGSTATESQSPGSLAADSASVEEVPVAGETIAPDQVGGTGSNSGAIETTPIETSSTAVAAPKELTHLAIAVPVAFDATRNERRPLKETVVALAAPTDVLAMRVSGFNYRGLICGFSILGEAPPSPVTIRQFVKSPAGVFDSGPIEVSWTKLDDASAFGGVGQSDSWNYSAEAHVNRSGPGWVVSLGGVTAPGTDEVSVTPTEGGCELRAAGKVFTPSTGPIGYWAGFAIA